MSDESFLDRAKEKIADFFDDDDDEQDGLCDDALQPERTLDEDVDGIVLFADLAGTDDLEEIAYRRAEWEALFGENAGA